jgi:hypothetical protein
MYKPNLGKIMSSARLGVKKGTYPNMSVALKKEHMKAKKK